MLTDVLLAAGGLLALVLIMAFVLNPPEAWVKKAFHRGNKPPSGDTDGGTNKDKR